MLSFPNSDPYHNLFILLIIEIRHGFRVCLHISYKRLSNQLQSLYMFEAPRSAWKFAYQLSDEQANSAIISMICTTRRRSIIEQATQEIQYADFVPPGLELMIQAEDEGDEFLLLLVGVVLRKKLGIPAPTVF